MYESIGYKPPTETLRNTQPFQLVVNPWFNFQQYHIGKSQLEIISALATGHVSMVDLASKFGGISNSRYILQSLKDQLGIENRVGTTSAVFYTLLRDAAILQIPTGTQTTGFLATPQKIILSEPDLLTFNSTWTKDNAQNSLLQAVACGKLSYSTIAESTYYSERTLRSTGTAMGKTLQLTQGQKAIPEILHRMLSVGVYRQVQLPPEEKPYWI